MSDNWLADVIAKENAYDEGYEAGKASATTQIFEDIDDLLDRCARDNGEMIVRALTELKKKHGVCQ